MWGLWWEQNTLPQNGGRWVAGVEQRPWLLYRVIQMIDENKEQLRNLFRNYNVLDVQPAISVQLPDDMSALQVRVLCLSPPACSLGCAPGPAC